MTSLTPDKALSRKEIVIPITLSGLWKGLEKIFVTAPLNAFEFAAPPSSPCRSA